MSEKICLCRESNGSVGIDDLVDVFLVKVSLRGCIGDFSVIPIPRACSNYFFSFAFHMFVNRCLLSDAYNHSKQSLDFMQKNK